jgi:hypothetical protein
MAAADVDEALVRDAISVRRGARRVLPFRYVAAARAAPQFTDALDQSLSEAIAELPLLPGRTLVLVDVSGSMDAPLSARSDLTRADAAAALAALIHGDVAAYSFSNRVVPVPERVGLAGVDNILRSQPHQGTELGGAVAWANAQPHDRLIVITDEQSHTHVPEATALRAYMINVASARNGVGYGERWTHLDGFSEHVIRFIHEFEQL